MRVLVIDNDRDTADLLALLLKTSGCEVRAAYDAFTGLEEAKAFQPRLLLADLAMPGMGGVELARQIRECRELDQTVLAAVTGWTDAAHRELATAAGFAEYLVKPVPLENVLQLVGRVAATVAESERLIERTRQCLKQGD